MQASSPSTSNVPSTSTNNFKLPNVQLPQIKIRPFSGDPFRWFEFWDIFDSTIHQSSLSDIEKLNYLISYLDGDALKIIRGLPIKSENYNVAIQLLQDRFGDQQIITNLHMNNIFNLRPITNLNHLKSFYEILETNLRSLRAAGVDNKEFDVVLTPLILNKLPYVTKRKFLQITSKDKITMEKLLNFLKEDVEISARCESYSPIHFFNKTKQFTSKLEQSTLTSGFKTQQNEHSSPSFHKHTNFLRSNSFNKHQSNNYGNDTQKPFISHCAYCTQDHPSKSCKKYSSIEERQTRLRELEICNRCLKTGHFSKMCNRYCGYCKDMHHISLCFKLHKLNTNKEAPPNKNFKESNQPTKTLSALTKNTHSLLQTAKNKSHWPQRSHRTN